MSLEALQQALQQAQQALAAAQAQLDALQAQQQQAAPPLDLRAAAAQLGVAPCTLRRAVREGRLRPSRFATPGRLRTRPLFTAADLDAYVRGNARAIGPAGLLRDPRPRGPRRPRLAACSGPRLAVVYGPPVAA